MKLVLSNIVYNGPTKKQLQDLPTSIIVEDYMLTDLMDLALEDLEPFADWIHGADAADALSNYISNQTDWLVEDFKVTLTGQFANLEGVDDSHGFDAFEITDLFDLIDTIEQTFGFDQDGDVVIRGNEFTYSEREHNIFVTGSF